MNPGQQCRVNPLHLIFHSIQDGTSWAGELVKQERDQIQGAAIMNAISDQLSVTIHQAILLARMTLRTVS